MSDSITFRTLGPSDLDTLLSVRDGLFDNPVDPMHARAFLDDPLHVIVLGFADHDAVAMATGTVLLHPDKPPSMFVNEVAVREAWQRLGIGRRVVEEVFAVARARGCQGIWLGTEPDNTAALALYRGLGGEEIGFVGFGWDDAF